MGREHWVEITLNQACDRITDGTHQTPKYQKEGVPFISTANIVPFAEGFDFSEYRRFISKQVHEELTKRTKPQKGDLLISKCGTIGRTKEIDVDYEFSIFVGLALLKPKKRYFASRFLEFVINSPDIQRQLNELAPGTTRKTLTITGINTVTIPLPPLNEQRRIVEKLDAILPKVKCAKSRLEKIPGILKKFRQSVLAAACSGRLTEDWRDGKDLPEWERRKIDSIVKSVKSDIRTGPFGTSLKKNEHQKNGVPVWGIESIGENGEFTYVNKIFVTRNKSRELKTFEVKGGDIIISRSGTVGELCILPDDISFGLISTNLMKISLDRDVIVPKYFCWLFEGAQIVIEKIRELCSGSTRLFLTQGILKNLFFPLPPLPEQHEIVRRVEKLFALAHSLEAKYRKTMERVEKIEQSVLAKAFRGELVEPDPNDEPAEELLKRILAKKAKFEVKKKTRKKK
ncbi:MAG: restriction endonuclease subunit S [Candidatus Zixiibacteriota bacterium]